MELPVKKPEKIKLSEINSYLTCYLCKGYLIDATTISECLHSFCRSCIIKFLQENSYCPVCEVIINKAKPNLKLDKTLQDIVYKLVPELFLKEMKRRKLFYQQYPQIAARVSPEERGEDIERTIFNPQDFISLSMEYISDDSTPGAIRIPEAKTILEKGKNGCNTEELQESIMKRYLQCPGMCRIELLKKFVSNKYNVDTTKFHIDILYKRVPLPDHYTLIDIAYIYSWKRNEPMKFFFRITDINKLSSRFDFFDVSQPHSVDVVSKPASKSRHSSVRRRDSGVHKKHITSSDPSQNLVKVCDKPVPENSKSEPIPENVKSELKSEQPNESPSKIKNICDIDTSAKKTDIDKCVNKIILSEIKPTKDVIEPKTLKPTNQVSSSTDSVEKTKACAEKVKPKPIAPKPNPTEQSNNKNIAEKSNKSYTNITLNRTNNVEIITKIQPVSNKNGQPIGHHIIKQTFKRNNKEATPTRNTSKKVSQKIKKVIEKPTTNVGKPTTIVVKPATKAEEDVYNFVDETSTNQPEPLIDDEKSRFLKSIELTAKTPQISLNPKPSKTNVKTPSVNGQKRKPSSPHKNTEKSTKRPKIDKKQVVKIIIHDKPTTPSAVQKPNEMKRDGDLQSLIDSCKINIPSSLSITLKETSENSKQPSIPPVKNYIEILKIPDESSEDKTKVKVNDSILKESLNPERIGKLTDNDSEQKVDQDLSDIAKSLTEKIPLSTTVSHIIGPKQQYPIPVKTNVPAKFTIQPSPVPELPPKLLNVPKDPSGKLTPRSPQTFQKIFEESIKKPDGQKTGPDQPEDQSNSLQTNSKRNILEIASQLYKKTKMEQDKLSENQVEETPAPKIPIPRLPNQRTLQPPQKKTKVETDSVKFAQTIANLHSSSLGLNYTVSVGQSSPTKTTKVNGIVSPVKAELQPENKPIALAKDVKPPLNEFKSSPRTPEVASSVPRNLSPIGVANSPKHSPKSSPMIKHMYAPKISTGFSPKPQSSKPPHLSPKAPVSSSLSPKTSPSSPKVANASPAHSGTPSLTTNEILEKYNIPNLAQLTASFNFNAANFGLNTTNQLAAIQQAMLLKHIEMQNRQNWLNMNQGPLLQYEKYLQSLNGKQNHLLGNIKEN